jgi:hypothetical protein
MVTSIEAPLASVPVVNVVVKKAETALDTVTLMVTGSTLKSIGSENAVILTITFSEAL